MTLFLNVRFPSSNFIVYRISKLSQVYSRYRRICRKLGIKLSREFIKGTHSFRRNAISKVANASNGVLAMAAELYGNSPQVAYANYYTGINLESAKNVLDA